MEQKAKRLQYLVSKYPQDFADDIAKYEAACKRFGEVPADYLHNAELYKGTTDVINVSTVLDEIAKGIEGLKNRHPELKNEIEAKKRKRLEEKRAKRKASRNNGKTCDSCGHNDFAFLQSRAADNNHFITPNGVKVNGYMPDIVNVCDSDGTGFDLCIHCGKIWGFDREATRRAIEQVEQEEGEGGDSSEDDDDDE